MEKIVCFSKVNIFLLVKKNYFFNKKLHKIDSLFYLNKNLFDEIYIEDNSFEKKDIINYFFNKKNIKINNCILTKTIKMFRDKGFFSNVFFKININKNIPMGSGLGGASSNSAQLILFLCKKININFLVFKNDIQKIGSDIFFFLWNYEFARVRKYGNKVSKINNEFKVDINLVVNDLNCSTKLVYKSFDNFYKKNKKVKSNFYKQLNFFRQNNFEKLQNDLLEPCLYLYPDLKKKYLDLKANDKNIKMSGSGSTFFILHFKK